jgi:hypothetical protein
MRNILFVLGFVGLFILYGCDGDGGGLFGGSGCGNQFAAADDGFDFQLLEEKTNKNLLGIQGRYNSDTVQIYDWNREKITSGRVRNDGRMSIQPISKLDADLDSIYSKDYCLYLDLGCTKE